MTCSARKTFFLLHLERKTKIIKVWTKFYIKQAKLFAVWMHSFAVAQQTSTAKLTVFFKNFKKQCTLKGLMKLQLLQKTLSLTIFLH